MLILERRTAVEATLTALLVHTIITMDTQHMTTMIWTETETQIVPMISVTKLTTAQAMETVIAAAKTLVFPRHQPPTTKLICKSVVLSSITAKARYIAIYYSVLS